MVVSNPCGQATSAPPAGGHGGGAADDSQAAVGQTLCAGEVGFEVEARGEPAPGYQWRWNGNAIAGATESHYAVVGALGDPRGEL